MKNMLACTNVSYKHNAIFGTDDLNHGMLKRAVMDSSVGGRANAIRHKQCNTRLTGGMHRQSGGLDGTQSEICSKTG